MTDPLAPLIKALQSAGETQPGAPTALATITNLSSAGALVLFDGESVASSRRYLITGSGGAVGDRVVMHRVGSTWVVGAKVQAGPAVEVVAQQYNGAWNTAVPGPTTGSAFTVLGGGMLRGVVAASGYVTAGNINLQIQAWIDGNNIGNMESILTNAANVRLQAAPLAFGYALGPGTHYMYFRLVAGSTGIDDRGSFFGIVTPT